jgi:Invasion associated locus B (IalB) protein
MDARILLTAGLILAGTGAAVAAQTGAATTLGSFKQWTAYSSSDAGGKMCFIASEPTNSKYAPSAPKSRDKAYFMVTTIPAKKIKNEASTIIGYAFKEGSKVTVDVEGKKFTMFTDKDNAWIENQAQEATLVSAMKGAKTMSVEGTSKRGTVTTDTYSLSGLASALDAIAKECPVK